MNQALARFSYNGWIWPLDSGLPSPMCCRVASSVHIGSCCSSVYLCGFACFILVVSRVEDEEPRSSPCTSVHTHVAGRSTGTASVNGVNMLIGTNIWLVELCYDFQVNTWVIRTWTSVLLMCCRNLGRYPCALPTSPTAFLSYCSSLSCLFSLSVFLSEHTLARHTSCED